MRIGEVAAATAVSVRSLRYYEGQGLLSASRTAGGQREYTADAVERVRWIQSLFAAGLTSRTVRALVPCVHSGVASEDMVERLERERDRIAARIQELAGTRDRLDEVIAQASSSARARERPGAGNLANQTDAG